MARIVGNNSSNTLYGTGFDDEIFGLGGDDTLIGGYGYNILNGGAGADYIAGGQGTDVAEYDTSTGGVMATIGGYGAFGDAQGDFISNEVERISGSHYADKLIGNDANNVLWGNGGDDELYGQGGKDELIGGEGDDRLIGGAGADILRGGNGFDTASYQDASTGVAATIGGTGSNGIAEGDQISDDIENLFGSIHADALYGNDKSNLLNGSRGDDALIGRGGGDRLIGGEGADNMYGGDGNDIAEYSSSGAGVNVDLRGVQTNYYGANTGSGGDAQGDRLFDIEGFIGSNYDDTVIGSNGDNYLSGNAGNDALIANAGNDSLFGGAGKDYLSGEIGDDDLYGEDGADNLFGGTGNDRLFGGDGNDNLTGGTGKDTFRFVNDTLGDTDTIKDFHRSEGDKISLSAIDANTKLAGDQNFTFIGTNAFSGVAGQLHYSNNGFETTLTGDVNGDKFADFTIKLTDAPGLISTDFLL